MQLTKNTSFLLVIMGVVFFAAGLVRAGGVAEEWVARYNGPANNYDFASAIAVDSSGNVYVTGYSTGIGTGTDYVTIKYDQNGGQLWVARYNGPGNSDDQACSIAVDISGNVYVSGYSEGSGTGTDYATVKYDTNGTQLWVARYNGPGNSTDYAYAMAIDNSGNVYVTGGSYSSNSETDYTTVKYDANGNQLWVAHYNGPGPLDAKWDYATAMVLDDSCNVYVTGYSPGSGTGTDYATVKYDTNGTQLWVARYNGPGNNFDRANAIVLDNSGNIYVTGQSKGSNGYTDYATVKYGQNGTQLWVARYDGPGNGNDYANAITVDSSGNVYVTGYVYCPGDNYATIKYDTNGNQLWVARYNGWTNFGAAYAIALDNSGNIYVTGVSNGSGTNGDYTTIKYDPNGNQIWVSRYNGPGNYDDQASAIAIDSSGDVYVTGYSYNGTNTDYATIKCFQNPVTLTMQTEPAEVNSVTPAVGTHQYAQARTVNISANRFADCPSVYVFDHWVGAVADANAASTTVVMDSDKTVKAVFVNNRQCGDECHPYPDGDLNHDCKIDFEDFAFMANNWLACTDPSCD